MPSETILKNDIQRKKHLSNMYIKIDLKKNKKYYKTEYKDIIIIQYCLFQSSLPTAFYFLTLMLKAKHPWWVFSSDQQLLLPEFEFYSTFRWKVMMQAQLSSFCGQMSKSYSWKVSAWAGPVINQKTLINNIMASLHAIMNCK